MKQLPLNEKQIEICDFILGNRDMPDAYAKLSESGYTDIDVKIATKFLLDNKLVSLIHPVALTELGAEWANSGIEEYLKSNRLISFLDSVIVRTVGVWAMIFITLVFNVVNCTRTNSIKNNTKENNKNYSDNREDFKKISDKTAEITVNKSAVNSFK